MLAVAAGLVLAIGLPTYLLPERTETLFSWTVNPPLTAAFLGAAYVAATVIEFAASRERRWANARIALPAVLLFTTLTLIVTLRHLDAFHLGAEHGVVPRSIAWAWLAIYVLVPPIMAVLWLQQVRAPGTDPPRGAGLPATLRVVLALQAAVMLAFGAALYIAPQAVADALWPWQLSPLTGGAVGAWLFAIGVGVAHALWEHDLHRIRSFMLGGALFGLLEVTAVLRFAGARTADGAAVLSWGQPRIWLYLLMVVSLVATAGWTLVLWRRRAHEPAG